MPVEIREARPEDVSRIHELIVELAVFEKEPDSVHTTPEELLEDGFGEHPAYKSFVAIEEGVILGFALTYVNYSTWNGKCLYLEDLCVTQAARGKGIGSLLFERVVEEAKNRKVRRMDWQVLEWNEPAIEFYKKYEATLDGEWINGRLFFER